MLLCLHVGIDDQYPLSYPQRMNQLARTADKGPPCPFLTCPEREGESGTNACKHASIVDSSPPAFGRETAAPKRPPTVPVWRSPRTDAERKGSHHYLLPTRRIGSLDRWLKAWDGERTQ